MQEGKGQGEFDTRLVHCISWSETCLVVQDLECQGCGDCPSKDTD